MLVSKRQPLDRQRSDERMMRQESGSSSASTHEASNESSVTKMTPSFFTLSFSSPFSSPTTAPATTYSVTASPPPPSFATTLQQIPPPQPSSSYVAAAKPQYLASYYAHSSAATAAASLPPLSSGRITASSMGTTGALSSICCWSDHSSVCSPKEALSTLGYDLWPGQRFVVSCNLLCIREGCSIAESALKDPLPQGTRVRLVSGALKMQDGRVRVEIMTEDDNFGWCTFKGVDNTLYLEPDPVEV